MAGSTLITWEESLRDLHGQIKEAIAKGVQIRVERARPIAMRPVEGEERTIEYVASDETVDRYGDIVRVKGWDLKNYQKGQAFLWAHDYSLLPLGTGVKAWKAPADGNSGPRLMSWLQYAPRELSEFADTVYRMVLAKIIKSVSVGFAPQEYNEPKSDEERKQLGLGKWGVEFLKQELLEISQVSVPANPNANATSFEADFVKQIGEAMKEKEARDLFGKDEAKIFVRDAGELYAAAAIPVLRDLNLLPTARAISLPPGEVEITSGSGDALGVKVDPVASMTALSLSGDCLKEGEVLFVTIRKGAAGDVDVSCGKQLARESVREVVKEELKGITGEMLKAILDEAEETREKAAVNPPEPDPKMATPEPDEVDAASLVLIEGINSHLDKALSGFSRERK